MLAFLIAAQTFVADRFDKKNDRGATAVEYGLLVGRRGRLRHGGSL